MKILNTFPKLKKDDSSAWVDIAKNIISGKYRKAHKGLVRSLTIGIQNINDPACVKALVILKGMTPR